MLTAGWSLGHSWCDAIVARTYLGDEAPVGGNDTTSTYIGVTVEDHTVEGASEEVSVYEVVYSLSDLTSV